MQVDEQGTGNQRTSALHESLILKAIDLEAEHDSPKKRTE
jgi:hypothetical protein